MITLAGCTATLPPPEGERHLPVASIGQRIGVDGPQLTPLEVLEDSRCPAGEQCVWAGRVRIRVAVHLGAGDRMVELEQGKPVPVADGALELVQVTPAKTAEAIAPAAYRFSFRFDGGI
ncbi:hypothetical protein V5740_04350 [Croceibacterium sp. TMG7-5b_MA50]|uniref:hypothetical protein n=1 Tax=Croceibacterium sp. TMG7-5b_MA50 TaxID=3121290 RepID=UPI003221741A